MVVQVVVFKIEKGVRQGYLVAPYIILIVGEKVTNIVKKTVTEGMIRGGFLPEVENSSAFFNIQMTHRS